MQLLPPTSYSSTNKRAILVSTYHVSLPSHTLLSLKIMGILSVMSSTPSWVLQEPKYLATSGTTVDDSLKLSYLRHKHNKMQVQLMDDLELASCVVSDEPCWMPETITRPNILQAFQSLSYIYTTQITQLSPKRCSAYDMTPIKRPRCCRCT